MLIKLSLGIYFLFSKIHIFITDYNFAILDNAFLIHKPGIKTKKEKLKNIKPGKLANQNKFIKKIVLPELKLMYGKKKGCYIPWCSSKKINRFLSFLILLK